MTEFRVSGKIAHAAAVFGYTLIAFVLSACASSPITDASSPIIIEADRYMEAAREPQYNSVIRQSDQEGYAFSKVSGQARGPVAKDELVNVLEFQFEGVAAKFWVPHSPKGAFATAGLFDSTEGWHAELLLAAEKTLREVLAPLPNLTERRSTINVVVAPAGSGLWLREPISFRSQDQRTSTWFMAGYSERDADRRSTTTLWARISRRFAEHLMHLEQLLGWPDAESAERQIDYSTAVTLYGLCGTGRFLLHSLGEGAIGIKPPPDFAEYFSGSIDRQFTPRTAVLAEEKVRSAGTAIAMAFSLYAFSGEDGSIDISDEAEIIPMLAYCDTLGADIPAFSQGETGLPERL